MMAVSATLTNSNSELVRFGVALVDHGATIAQNGSRATVLKHATVMAYDNANANWVPWTSVAAANGQSVPAGIYVGDDIAAATLVAAAVSDAPILKGGWCILDNNKIVLDGDVDLDDVVNATNQAATTPAVADYIEVAAWQVLAWAGIHVEDTSKISAAQA
jgi:hypothetical protein